MGDGEGSTNKKHETGSDVVVSVILEPRDGMDGGELRGKWDGASSGGRTSTSASVIGRTDAGQG